MLMLCRYACYGWTKNLDTEISATSIYSDGAYLYVENRLSEIKRLLL